MSEAPHYGWLAGRQAGHSSDPLLLRRREATTFSGTEVRLASQLPGKPVAGAYMQARRQLLIKPYT